MPGHGVAQRQVCRAGFIPGDHQWGYWQESEPREPELELRVTTRQVRQETTLCSYYCMGTLALITVT